MMETVKVYNDNMEVIKEYTVNVDTEEFKRVLTCVGESYVEHISRIYEGYKTPLTQSVPYPDSYDNAKWIAESMSKAVIAGGCVTDVLMGKEIKDIDVAIYPDREAAHHSVLITEIINGEQEGGFFHYAPEGVTAVLEREYGFLSRPYCYDMSEEKVLVHKTRDKRIDFLFMKKFGRLDHGSILTNIVNEYDQSIKLGFYDLDGFHIHEEMYHSMNEKRVSYNHRLSGPTPKELVRLEKAIAKYSC